MLFLVVNSWFFFYGAFVIGTIFYSRIVELDLFHAVFINSQTREEYKATNMMIFNYLVHRYISIYIYIYINI